MCLRRAHCLRRFLRPRATYRRHSQRSEVTVAVAVGNRVEKTLVDDVGHRHGYPSFVGRRERQPQVFQVSESLKPAGSYRCWAIAAP